MNSNVRTIADYYRDLYDKIINAADNDNNIIGNCIDILLRSEKLDTDKNVIIWGDNINKINEMPRDSFVELVQKPTHYAVAAVMNAFMRSKEVREFDGMLRILVCGMRGACRCGFAGHGYEAEEVLKENLAIYEVADIEKFLAEYGYLCPEFTSLVVNSKSSLLSRTRGEKYAKR